MHLRINCDNLVKSLVMIADFVFGENSVTIKDLFLNDSSSLSVI